MKNKTLLSIFVFLSLSLLLVSIALYADIQQHNIYDIDAARRVQEIMLSCSITGLGMSILLRIFWNKDIRTTIR